MCICVGHLVLPSSVVLAPGVRQTAHWMHNRAWRLAMPHERFNVYRVALQILSQLGLPELLTDWQGWGSFVAPLPRLRAADCHHQYMTTLAALTTEQLGACP